MTFDWLRKRISGRASEGEKTRDADYHAKYLQEIKNYDSLYESEAAKDNMSYSTPDIWKNVDIFMFHKISAITKTHGMIGYIADHCNRSGSRVRILTLGSGPCNLEINELAPGLHIDYEIIAVDINESVCRIAQGKAEKKGIPFTYVIQDANRLSLEPETYDVIIAFASLHHFLEIDHITREFGRGLKKDGIVVTLDIPTRNGYRLWDESKVVVDGIMKVLPEEFRLNHYTKKVDDEYIDRDLSEDSFECINSESIIPCLRQNLQEIVFVPAHSIARRFFDNMYGFNFDRNPDFGNAFQQFIFRLDEYYLERGLLKPETFFGVYSRK